MCLRCLGSELTNATASHFHCPFQPRPLSMSRVHRHTLNSLSLSVTKKKIRYICTHTVSLSHNHAPMYVTSMYAYECNEEK